MAKIDRRDSAPPENMLTMPRIVFDWSAKNRATSAGLMPGHRDERADAVDDQRADQEQQATANLPEAGSVAEGGSGIACVSWSPCLSCA